MPLAPCHPISPRAWAPLHHLFRVEGKAAPTPSLNQVRKINILGGVPPAGGGRNEVSTSPLCFSSRKPI